jgi:hypothetical protein
MSSATLFICSVLVASILSSVFDKPVKAQTQNNPFSLSTQINQQNNSTRAALIADVNDSSTRLLFQDPSQSKDHQYDGARMVAALKSNFSGAFDDFSYLYTYNWSSGKTRLVMYGNDFDLKAMSAGVDSEQIDKIASLLGFHVTGFSQYAKTREIIMALETP